MAGVWMRPSDKARGKRGKWTGWWRDEHGKRRKFAGTTDKAITLKIAQEKEAEAALVRAGLLGRAAITRREAGAKPAPGHIVDYRDSLLAKGDTAKHANHIAGVLKALLDSAGIRTVGDLGPDRLQEALGRLKVRRSARTANHAMQALKAFGRWLSEADRIEAVPKGVSRLRPYNEDADRKRVRRALTSAEMGRLVEAAEVGSPIVRRSGSRHGPISAELTGPDRAMLYRVAMGTGFRADELRSLTPESFDLTGDEPRVTVAAAYSKHRRDDRQPIMRDLAETLQPWVAARPPDRPVFFVPEKTAKMLAVDLKAAGIEPVDAKGRVVDFHALRGSYITELVRRGVNPKLVQKLARHSTITLTLDTYTHVDDDELRRALEGEG